MPTNRTRQRGGWRRALAVAIATLLAVTLAGLVTSPAEASSRWNGYKIRKCSYADCSWIGGRADNGAKIYRFQPRKANVDSGFGAQRFVSDANGSEYPSATGTARLAYVLSVYGSYSSATQAAATDALVYHYMKGRRWGIDNRRYNIRARQSGHGRAVKSYVKEMNAAAAKYAGPYSQNLTASTAAVGSSTKVTYKLTSAAGYGMKGLPVTINYDGQTASAYTDSSGVATAYFTVQTAGARPVSATASRVPESRLVVRDASRTRASDVVQAGILRTLTASTEAAGTSGQTVVVTNGAANRMTGQTLDGTYTVTGGSGSRSVTFRAYGPFATSGGTCTGTPAYSSSTTIPGSGTRALPAYTATTSGYYRWGVNVGANAYSTAASTCGANVTVQKQAAIGQYRNGTQVTFGVGKAFRVGARISGFDRSETHTVTSRLYGPFVYKEKANCGDRLIKTVSANVTGNGDKLMPTVSINSTDNKGWFIWQSTLSSGELIRGGASSCGVLIQVK